MELFELLRKIFTMTFRNSTDESRELRRGATLSTMGLVMVTEEDYFGRMSRHTSEEPSAEIRANAAVLLERVNTLLSKLQHIDCARKPVVNSGWRTPRYNSIVPGAAPNSKHMTGQAIDLSDPDGELDNLLYGDQKLLLEHLLWMEHPAATKGWCHLQSVPPRSGNLVFYP